LYSFSFPFLQGPLPSSLTGGEYAGEAVAVRHRAIARRNLAVVATVAAAAATTTVTLSQLCCQRERKKDKRKCRLRFPNCLFFAS
jgi:hypothetical protein